jgi:hypothetical protein
MITGRACCPMQVSRQSRNPELAHSAGVRLKKKFELSVLCPAAESPANWPPCQRQPLNSSSHRQHRPLTVDRRALPTYRGEHGHDMMQVNVTMHQTVQSQELTKRPRLWQHT